MGAIIENYILNILLKCKINLDHWRDLVYDGTGAMASKSAGASAVIKR